MSGQAEVLTAVIAALEGGTATPVYGAKVPPTTTTPYYSVDSGNSTVDDDKTVNGEQITYVVHSWSTDGNEGEMLGLQKVAYDLLHRQSLTLTGGFTNSLHRQTSQTFVLDPDGVTFHGISRFETWIKES
jgi:hypothetical protein